MGYHDVSAGTAVRSDLSNYSTKHLATLYKDVIADLRESKRLLEEDDLMAAEDKSARLAQLEVVEVYTWFVLVTTFGDVPYSQAMDFQILFRFTMMMQQFMLIFWIDSMMRLDR